MVNNTGALKSTDVREENKDGGPNKVTLENLQTAVDLAEGKNIKNINNVASGTNVATPANWTTVVKRRAKTAYKPIVGSSSAANNHGLKAAPKWSFLHVFKLDPATTIENVSTFLKKEFPEVKCEQLTSKFPELYSSFKISVYDSHLESAIDASRWPNGCCINRFFHRRNPHQPNQ